MYSLISTKGILHIQQMARVSTQVILNTLLVTDVDEQALENTGTATFMNWNEHSALQHILQ